MVVGFDGEGERAPAELDVARQAVHSGDTAGLGLYPSGQGCSNEAIAQGARQTGLGQPGSEAGVARVPADIAELLGESERAHQVAAGKPGAIAQRELGRVHPDRIDEKAALDLKTFGPGAGLAELFAQLL